MSSGSVAAAVISAAGCGGTVSEGSTRSTGAGGSRSGTGGTLGRSGSGGVGGSLDAGSSFGGTSPGGTGGYPNAGGSYGYGGSYTAGGTYGFGGDAGYTGYGGAYGYGGTYGYGGVGGDMDAGPYCPYTNCYTCDELYSQFFPYMGDAAACVPIMDAGAASDAASDAPSDAPGEATSEGGSPDFACPNLIGAPTGLCQTICSALPRQGAMCCYGSVPTCVADAIGRPFSVGAEARRAPVVPRGDWGALEVGSPFELDDELREALARDWQRDAALEHASIASFARLTLELMALGAPPDLVEAAQQASIDEIAHAKLCFWLASRYSSEALGPGVLEIEGALLPNPDLARLAAETVREGCVGETIGALLAAEQLRAAVDPDVRQVLGRIAADEARHAELSWKIVNWAVALGGARVLHAVAEAFELATAAHSPLESDDVDPASIDPQDAAEWRAHGRILPNERSDAVAAAFRDVILPCARALLS